MQFSTLFLTSLSLFQLSSAETGEFLSATGTVDLLSGAEKRELLSPAVQADATVPEVNIPTTTACVDRGPWDSQRSPLSGGTCTLAAGNTYNCPGGKLVHNGARISVSASNVGPFEVVILCEGARERQYGCPAGGASTFYYAPCGTGKARSVAPLVAKKW